MKNQIVIRPFWLAFAISLLLSPAALRAQSNGVVVEEIVARVNNNIIKASAQTARRNGSNQAPIAPPIVASGYNAPKGLVVDPRGGFVYTADSADGTVAVSKIKGGCGSQICAGTTVSAESPHKANSGPFGITLLH